jgi:hypothetical protein
MRIKGKTLKHEGHEEHEGAQRKLWIICAAKTMTAEC